MQRKNVSSSNLASVWYDAKNEILEIEFNHWGVYQYNWVSENVYNSLISSASLGSYFAYNIKNNYSCIRIK